MVIRGWRFNLYLAVTVLLAALVRGRFGELLAPRETGAEDTGLDRLERFLTSPGADPQARERTLARLRALLQQAADTPQEQDDLEDASDDELFGALDKELTR